MPRYFFDIFDGESDCVDIGGRELQDEAAARTLALQTLADIAKVDILRGGEARITVRVRRNSVTLYSATMTLGEQWIRLDS
ncbi:hypothetical protein QO058_14275 [Bosea vestrisii]|uniref:DUF6894 family protein n=1 Tax=Bosea vestrisii TaxID=151416 RepID=UPI0024E033D7|nr:hypothetical protein [Bosea vestrisii]WID99298.1 hypothetical protein QO058_14275 [Bosea vestrisii]